VLGTLGLFSALFVKPASAGDPTSLRWLISLRFPGVDWVSTDELAQWLEVAAAGEEGAEGEGGSGAAADEASVVLLDVRTQDEFETSQIAGATRVDPDAEASPLDGTAPDRRIVVYCSVGYRSGAMARRLSKAGFTRVYNLEGGIFQWANEGRAIYRGRESVRVVHPYSESWSGYLDEPLRAAQSDEADARPTGDD
jgi:rhodanese-related sulfurtransferase